MFKKLLVLVVLMANISCASMSDSNKTLYGTWLLSQAVDTYQTKGFLDDGRKDINPLIKDKNDLYTVKISVVGITSGLLYLIPSETTKKWALLLINAGGWVCVSENEKRK